MRRQDATDDRIMRASDPAFSLASRWRSVEDLFDAEPRGPIHLRGYGPMETYTIVRRRSGNREDLRAAS